MFGIGPGELLVIFVIAIVVIGPQRLPEVARTIGKVFATFKRTGNQLRDQMQEEVRKFQDMEEVKEFKSVVESEMNQMQDTAQTFVKQEIEQAEKQLDEEARGIESAFTAEGGPASAAAPDPSIAPPEAVAQQDAQTPREPPPGGPPDSSAVAGDEGVIRHASGHAAALAAKAALAAQATPAHGNGGRPTQAPGESALSEADTSSGKPVS